MAIKQIVREYFLGRFQFSLLKTAYRHPQYLITQELNKEWCTPKKFKGDIKRPKPKKMKKEKVKKEKKPKTPKKGKSKSSKSSKKSSKKSKSSKDSKKSKKSSKNKKSGKKDKKQGMSKQEKAELARLKAEMKLREEMERKAEENKLFVFPLTDATQDCFFENIFTNWVKPKKGKGKGEKKAKAEKKGKKGKK